MKYLLIMNPGSRDGRSKEKFKKIFSLLKDQNLDYQCKYTSKLEDAYLFSLQANQSNNYDVIVAIGGDGTINGVLSGFYNKDGTRISKDTKMAVIYTGTSPDFCLSYNIPIDTYKAALLLDCNCVTRRVKKISIGRIQLKSKLSSENETSIGYFGCCANIGIGAKVAEGANTGIRKKIGDVFGTFVSLLKALFTYKAADFNVIITTSDMKVVEQKISKVINMFIGRTHLIASGIKVANDLNINSEKDDKNFFLLTVSNIKLFAWPKVLKILYSGEKFKNNDYISLSYAKRIKISCDVIESSLVEFDGDFQGYLPCEISMAEDKLDLITFTDDLITANVER